VRHCCRFGPCWPALLTWLVCLAGCRNPAHGPTSGLGLPAGDTAAVKLTGPQVADVQIAYARTLEKRGETGEALTSYTEALKQDPNRADALDRLAVLHDRQGKFEEAERLHRQAVAAQPRNADIQCNWGYSLYLQGRWAEAEGSLRQALAADPGHGRAHNNLGLVLAHAGRQEEALAEFRRGGCSEAQAHSNLAFGLTLEGCWPEARQHYEAALTADPSSEPAKKGLRELQAVVAKIQGRGRPAAVADSRPAAPTSDVAASPPAAGIIWQPVSAKVDMVPHVADPPPR
jgi:Tfp pilus assembly protein PilF